MDEEQDLILLIDEEDAPIITEQECEELKPILKDFIDSYVENKERKVEEWLPEKMKEQLPDRKSEEVQEMAEEIIETLHVNEEKLESLQKAVNNGRSKESWFASEVQRATSAMSAHEAAKYLAGLDAEIRTVNESLHNTITTQAGAVSQNPCLDGYIAEQYHAQTFNMNAKARGSEYRAKVLEPKGEAYAKNSVDIVIVDGKGKVVRRYQSKYCKDAKATEQAFKRGDYRGQRKLVPKEQQADISKKSDSVLEAPDGTTSNPLTKERAVKLRDEAQSGKWNDLNWNEYRTKDLAIGVGKQAGYAALQGAAIGVGFDIAQKIWTGEEIKGEEVVEKAISSGADFGVKAAVTGALKVGSEKQLLSFAPKGTPVGRFANIAHVAIEDVKIIGKMVTGELSVKEGIEKIEQTTVSTTAGLVAMGKGTAIGASLGAIFGPAGAAIGGFVGGTVGYMAGSKIGETVVKGVQKLRNGVRKVVETIGSGIKSTVDTVVSGVKSLVSGIGSIFGF